ncbi:MAG: hypothetical protein AAF717_22890 [Bacteroidota bacterium]
MKKLFVLFLLSLSVSFLSYTEEDDCTETVCPDGFNNCIETPCGL